MLFLLKDTSSYSSLNNLQFLLLLRLIHSTKVQIDYNKLFKGEAVYTDNQTDIVVDWVKMNQIYTELGMSHNQFRDIYGTAAITVSPDLMQDSVVS